METGLRVALSRNTQEIRTAIALENSQQDALTFWSLTSARTDQVGRSHKTVWSSYLLLHSLPDVRGTIIFQASVFYPSQPRDREIAQSVHSKDSTVPVKATC